MLDPRFILEHPDQVQRNCDHRGAKADVSRYVELEQQRRQLQQDVEELSRQANVVSKSIGKAKDEAEREARKEEGRRLREEGMTADDMPAVRAIIRDAAARDYRLSAIVLGIVKSPPFTMRIKAIPEANPGTAVAAAR